MSFAIDVNILLYASDTSSPFNARARDALTGWVAKAPRCFASRGTTLMSYLRIATHSSTLPIPWAHTPGLLVVAPSGAPRRQLVLRLPSAPQGAVLNAATG